MKHFPPNSNTLLCSAWVLWSQLSRAPHSKVNHCAVALLLRFRDLEFSAHEIFFGKATRCNFLTMWKNRNNSLIFNEKKNPDIFLSAPTFKNQNFAHTFVSENDDKTLDNITEEVNAHYYDDNTNNIKIPRHPRQ